MTLSTIIRRLAPRRAHGLAIASIVALATPAAANVLRVDADAAPGGDGTSFAAAYDDLQTAIANAVSGDEIWVVAGVYTPAAAGDRLASFQLSSNVALRGGFAGTETVAADRDQDLAVNVTILSGDLLQDDGSMGDGENSYNVVRGDGADATAILDRFTITAGNAGVFPDNRGAGMTITGGSPTIVDCLFTGNRADESFSGGGAVFIDSGSPSFTGCSFTGNDSSGTGNTGGAIFISSGAPAFVDCDVVGNHADANFAAGGGVFGSGGATPLFERCLFSGNTAVDGGVADQNASGGGLQCTAATLIDCRFVSNHSELGGALHVRGEVGITGTSFEGNTASRGGAIYRTGTSGNLKIVSSDFVDNAVTGQGIGGAIDFFAAHDAPSLTSCAFVTNSATSFGGAISGLANAMTVTNCLFNGNDAGACGGAVGVVSNSPTLTSCTLTSNTAGQGGGVCVTGSLGQPLLVNCVLWANADSGGIDETAQIDWANAAALIPIVDFCDVQGLTGALGGTGNIDGDPLFVDPVGADLAAGTGDEDLRLSAGSPCIDAGSNAALPADVDDLDGDGNIAEALSRDAGGLDRSLDDPATADTGSGVAPLVDIGAFEFESVDVDSDNDGLLDSVEVALGTDPLDDDTDDDGLLDGTEVDAALGSGCPDPLLADSDGDTLVDGAEVTLGTDPCEADSDGDGVRDDVDPLPTQPGVTTDYLATLTRDVADSIEENPNLDFNGPNENANLGRRNSLASRVRRAANRITAGNGAAAIDLLESVLQKVDGLSPPPDWIDDSAEKTALAAEIQLLIALVPLS